MYLLIERKNKQPVERLLTQAIFTRAQPRWLTLKSFNREKS